MEGIVIGQYVPGQSLLHRLDPRTKLTVSALLFWLVFYLKTPVDYLLCGIGIIMLYMSASITGSLFSVLKPGLYLIMFTVIINMFLVPGEVLVRLGFVVMSRDGLVQGLSMGLRLAYLIALSSLVTLTTSPMRMTSGLELLMKPLKRAGLPTSELAMMMNIALRFIPTFLEEIDRIIKTQTSRGADFGSWHPGRRLKYAAALLIPLFLSAFRRADELALAMESRGYEAGMERTSLNPLKMNRCDYIVLVSAVFFILAFVWWRAL